MLEEKSEPADADVAEGGALRQRDFRARMGDIPEVMALLADTFAASPAPPPDEALLFDLRLTVTEAFANIVEHSYGNEPDRVIRVAIEIASSWLEIRFEDFGRRPEPRRLRWRELGDYRERGLGLFLMSKCMDEVEFTFRIDGMNRLRTRRLLIRSGTQKAGAHLPFHVAVYEYDHGRRVYLIGHLDQARPDPLARLLPAAGETLWLDLASLDFIDASGLDKIENLAARSRKATCDLRLTRPPEHLAGLFAERGLESLVCLEEPAAPIGGKTAEDPRHPVARHLPLFRSFGSFFFPGAPDELSDEAGDPEVLLAAFAPERLGAGPLKGRLFLRRGPRTRALFARAVCSAEPEESLLFLGEYARSGVRALIGSAQLFSALGSYSSFNRARPNATLHDFIRLVSSSMRDLLPSVTADPDGDALHLVILEFSANGLRAITGVGPVLAMLDGQELRAISLATTENAITETRDLRYFSREIMPSRARLLLGRSSVEWRGRLDEASFEKIPGIFSSMAAPIDDQGVLDVSFG
jgi:anti-sigma regulatory factor (Ser/Thr protein kinase)/anti-anti-sigma regulatory factor